MSVARPTSAPDAVRDLDGLRRQLAGAPEADALRPLGLGRIVIGRGALDTVPELVASLQTATGDVAVVADCRAMAGADPDVKTAVERRLQAAGHGTRRVTVGDAEARVHVDAATLDGAAAACAGAALLVSVGSGSVTDVGKALSSRLELPLVVVQTAASVNGYADDQSVMLVDGVKRTVGTRWPDALVIDVDIVALAPPHLNRAGLGDLLATYTAPADWRLAALVGQDGSYSPTAVDLARAHVDVTVGEAAGIGVGEHGVIEGLAATLALSGISMGIVGRTSPGSGMEHTISHLLEMSESPTEAPPLHGAKVGALAVLATLLWARVREAARDGVLHDLRFPAEEEMRRRVHEAFDPLDPSGGVAEECWRDYERKLGRWHASQEHLRSLPERWEAFDEELDALLAPPERLAAALRAAGAPVSLSELGIDAASARWALANCHLMRDRFTVADLAFLLGRWEADDVDRLLDDAAALGAGL